jgi:hypothetical protein
MVKAGESFQRAADLLPRFEPAWSNLGATLGELDRPQEALRGPLRKPWPSTLQSAGRQ